MYFDLDIIPLGPIDILSIKSLIKDIPESAWEQDKRRLANKNFEETHTLWLRLMPMTADKIFHVFENLQVCGVPTLEKKIDNLHLDIEKALDGFIIRSSIIRLEPGNHVHRHVDGIHPLFVYGRRLIIPIITNPYVIFQYEDDRNYNLQEGIIYDTNGFVPHCTVNNGSETRYQFVIDLLPNSTREEWNKINFHKTWTQDQYQHAMSLVPDWHTNNVLPDWRTIRDEQKKMYDASRLLLHR